MKPIVCKIREIFKKKHIGSAEWRSSKDIAKKRDKDFGNNMILTQTELISKSMRKTNMNRHVMLIGRPGTRKIEILFQAKYT